MRGYKGGIRPMLRELAAALREQEQALHDVCAVRLKGTRT